jgi:hypothetical protein
MYYNIFFILSFDFDIENVGSDCYRIISSSGDIIARFLTVGNS